MRKTLVYGLAVLLSGTVQASATDDYLNGLKALDAGRQSEGLYLLEQAAVAGMPEAQFRLGELLPGQDGERWLRSAVRQGSVLAAKEKVMQQLLEIASRQRETRHSSRP